MAKGKSKNPNAVVSCKQSRNGNPPFKMSHGGGENLRQDASWKFGMPPVNNANYPWIQHSIHHLSPVGVAGLVMANSASGAPTNHSQ